MQDQIQPNPGLPVSRTLNQLVSRLATGILPEAVRRKSFIINDIPHEFNISIDEKMLSSVLNGLLYTAVTYSENSCIRISARVYGNIILVYVKDTRRFTHHTMSDRLLQLQPLAQKMGGNVSITTHGREVSAIAFSFPNVAAA